MVPPTVFVTSDTHFGHANIIGYSNRPFKDVAHMTEMLVKWWNETVGEDDIVIFLGDACMGIRENTVPILSRLNGKKTLFSGNHDDCHPMYMDKKKYPEKLALYEKYFSDIVDPPLTQGGYGDFAWCHFPYPDNNRENDDRRWDGWELEDNGKTLLCGHVHEAWHIRRSQKGTIMYNVGMDVHDYRPVAINTVRENIKKYQEGE